METYGPPPQLLKRLGQIYSINGNRDLESCFFKLGLGEN